jgi:hypothetical protein
MTDRALAEDWFRRYRIAWESNEVDDIRGLFTSGAVYRGFPDDPDPYLGLDAIVAGWLANADQPGDTDFEWKLLAVDGDVAIAECVTVYVNSNPPKVYDNLFVITLPEGGQATEFTDWWIERKPEDAA